MRVFGLIQVNSDRCPYKNISLVTEIKECTLDNNHLSDLFLLDFISSYLHPSKLLLEYYTISHPSYLDSC